MEEQTPKEQIEDLQYNGLKIIQPTNGYRFTTDAVLLANYVKNVKNKKVVELGCGSGVISTLVAAKQSPERVIGIELLPHMADMAERSVQLNQMEDKIKIICMDARGCHRTIGSGFDAVVVNPPYRKIGSGETQQQEDLYICRHEVTLTLADVFEESNKLLKYGGSLYLVHQFERLADSIALGSNNGLSAKEVCLIFPKPDSAPNLFLMRFVKGGKIGLKWQTPLTVFDKDGNYTKTIKQLYS